MQADKTAVVSYKDTVVAT